MQAKNTPNAVMVLTPPSSAAIAVVRLRGPNVATFLKNYFSKNPHPGRCIHGELRDGQQLLDDPVILLAPDSTWADISLHGGPWIVQSILDLAGREGFSLQSAKMPLADSFLDDADSPLEREMLAHLPLARTKLALTTLLAQPILWQTALGTRLDPKSIAEDFSLWWLLNPPQIAIVGEPNVGKSTLANQLFGQERSITADLPGTTRDWVGEIADIDGLAAILVDTPGQRHTEDPLEQAAIQASQEKITQSHLVLFILDATRPPKQIPNEGLIIINKVDQPKKWNLNSVKNALPISAKTGKGLEILRQKIREHFGIARLYEPRPHWWTHPQREILIRAASAADPMQYLRQQRILSKST